MLATTAFLITMPVGALMASTEVAAEILVKDIKGSYAIPYIQSDRDLRVTVDFSVPEASAATLQLRGADFQLAKVVQKESPVAQFNDLPPGEFTLAIAWQNVAGEQVAKTVFTRIGIGTVVAALGDSLTEGYHGQGFKQDNLELKASDFPAAAVSKDGRNFPQFAPTTAHHKPSVNCFQSWMSALNDSLALAWQQPVFIANEGWGGYTSANYLAMMRTNGGGWRDRMQRLKPTTWLIHLGVNDERAKMPAAEFAQNMGAIVDLLIADYAARPENIYLARPSYDYAEGAEAILKSYIVEIDRLVQEKKLRAGPDFFAAFAQDQAKWYGTDPVHPGPDGIEWMAKMWGETLATHAPLPPPTPNFMRELRNGKTQTIVTYGTSLTAGGAWVAGLQEALNKAFPGQAKVINSGKGAMCSVWGVENLDAQVIANLPDALIMEFSVNDAYLPYQMTPADCQQNLDTLIKRIREDNPACEIILMVMNPMVEIHAERRPRLEEFNEIYRATAKREGFLLIDHYPAWQALLQANRQEFDRLVPDGAHPSSEGCARIVTPNILNAIGLP